MVKYIQRLRQRKMSDDEMIEFLNEEILSLTKSIKREVSLKKELENDKATLTHIEEMIDNGDALAPESVYPSLSDWAEAIKKQIKTSETSIASIGVYKEIKEAYIMILDKLGAPYEPAPEN